MSQVMQMADEMSNRTSVFSLKNHHDVVHVKQLDNSNASDSRLEPVLLSKTNSTLQSAANQSIN